MLKNDVTLYTSEQKQTKNLKKAVILYERASVLHYLYHLKKRFLPSIIR